MTMQTHTNDQAIAAAFVAARRAGSGIASYPGIAPATLTDAYRIQDLALSLDGRQVVGWKVGRINPPLSTQLGSDRLAGPIFADAAVIADGQPDMPVFADGFVAAEAELLLHVAPGFAGPIPTDDAGTRAILDDIRLGIEVASSPYPGINTGGPCVTASDFGNNAGLVLGASLVGWRDIDTMLDGPYGAVRFLLANLATRGIDISGGLWVSTGAITGVHEAGVGQKVIARFGDHGDVRCTLVAAGRRDA